MSAMLYLADVKHKCVTLNRRPWTPADEGPLTEEERKEQLDKICDRDAPIEPGDEVLGALRGIQGISYTQPQSRLLTLPYRLRRKIFFYIGVQERMKLVVLCRQCRDEVRGLMGIRVGVKGDSYSGPIFARDVRSRSLYVGKYDHPIFNPRAIVVDPERLKELVFGAPISISYLDGFIRTCKRLRSLVILERVSKSLPVPTLNRSGYGGEYEWRPAASVIAHPPMLSFLQILIIWLPAKGSEGIFSDLLQALSHCTWLKRMTVVIGSGRDPCDPVPYHTAAMLFIGVKAHTHLKSFTLSTHQRKRDLDWTDHEFYLGIPKEKIVQTSQSVQLHELTLTEVSVGFKIWEAFLEHQDQLRTFQVLHLMYWDVIKQCIERNQAFLKKVAIHALLSEKEPKEIICLDLAVFAPCVCLEELFICIGIPKVTGASWVYNFRKLPKSLVCLNLRQVTVVTKDFVSVLELPKLRCLGILNHTNKGDFGVDFDALMKIHSSRTLVELLVSKLTAPPDHEPRKRLAIFNAFTYATKSRVNKKRETLYLGWSNNGYWKYNRQYKQFVHALTGSFRLS